MAATSPAAQVCLLPSGGGDRVHRPRLLRDMVLALTALGFALWLVAGAGYAAVYRGVLFLLAGVPVYAWRATSRGRGTAESEPVGQIRTIMRTGVRIWARETCQPKETPCPWPNNCSVPTPSPHSRTA
ncbi:hypothetical protein [Streptomyces sp. MUM 203J]|uniref:hypothetical protein n=1 Tax=Streptomyces sp. MUM 203J TaxID=2791990 RepID=UPI0035AB73BD